MFGVFILFFATSAAFAAPAPTGSWECEKPYWIADAEIEDGVFQAAIGGSCSIRLVNNTQLSEVMGVLRNELERSGKYVVHAGPEVTNRGGVPGFHYDLTDPVSDTDGKVKIRQDVFLGTDGTTSLLYETESKEIQAEGPASYLQKVTFSAKMRKVSSGLTVLFSNSVWVKRPWMVFNFVFKPMGRRITEQKFELARTKLLEHFLTNATP